MAKGSPAASPGLNGEPAPPRARFLAWKPFAVNAAPIDYLDTLLVPEHAEDGQPFDLLSARELGQLDEDRECHGLGAGALH